jgi:hypothetical protein
VKEGKRETKSRNGYFIFSFKIVGVLIPTAISEALIVELFTGVGRYPAWLP